MDEIWKDISSNPRYQVSNLGRVRNKETERVKVCNPSADNRLRVCLSKPQDVHMVSRLVAEAFLPKVDGCYFVGHKDKDTTNCRASNLYWKKGKQPIPKSVRCIETGKVYKSSYAAAKDLHIAKSSVYSSLRAKTKRSKSIYSFELVEK